MKKSPFEIRDIMEKKESIRNVIFLIRRFKSERSKIIRNSPGVRLGTGKICERNCFDEGLTLIIAPSQRSSSTLALTMARELEE